MGDRSDYRVASTTEHPSARTGTVCLNFKVPRRVRQQFKAYAARHDMTMTELLLHLLEENIGSDLTYKGVPGEGSPSIKK
jgi:hypothetical protein